MLNMGDEEEAKSATEEEEEEEVKVEEKGDNAGWLRHEFTCRLHDLNGWPVDVTSCPSKPFGLCLNFYGCGFVSGCEMEPFNFAAKKKKKNNKKNKKKVNQKKKVEEESNDAKKDEDEIYDEVSIELRDIGKGKCRNYNRHSLLVVRSSKIQCLFFFSSLKLDMGQTLLVTVNA